MQFMYPIYSVPKTKKITETICFGDFLLRFIRDRSE